MISKIQKPAFILLSFCLTLGLYWNSLHGEPVFDDFDFLFQFNVIIDHFSFWTIFKDFCWPISVSTEKILFNFWQHKYFNYHLLNLFLHFINSFFLLKLVERVKVPYPRFIFLLFLLHPSNVIAVSWMVQLKTLMCFTFSILSIFLFLEATQRKIYYLPSWFLFLLSTLSKASSVPLSVLFLLYMYKKKEWGQILWVLPFLFISIFSVYRILKSPVTVVGANQLSSSTFISDNKSPPSPDTNVKYLKPEEGSSLKEVIAKLEILLKTFHYYFSQVLLPLESVPLKGQSPSGLGWPAILQFIVLIALLVLNWRNMANLCLTLGCILLSPYLGIFSAPYMNVTWVSEQHLYLVLPFFLCFWLILLANWKFKFAYVLPSLLIIFFSIQTHKASAYYQDEIVFYSKSLEANPQNLPVAYNLTTSYLKKNQPFKAMAVTGMIIEMSRTNSEIKSSKYFPRICELHRKMVEINLKKP